jgi:secondary thiamine-phosphate synthase enzyme
MRQAQTILTVRTRGKEFSDITDEVARWVRQSGLYTGLLTLFLQHTSASLTIQENADPDVLRDLQTFLGHIAPEDPHGRRYRHHTEGADDMPAHIRTVLTGVSLSVPVVDGVLGLGTWQAIYVMEHRARGHDRHVVLHLVGE